MYNFYGTHKGMRLIIVTRCGWQTVENGLVRVNYYIKELYGDPDIQLDAWKHPLAIFALEGRCVSMCLSMCLFRV
jgi:hypothetical protein